MKSPSKTGQVAKEIEHALVTTFVAVVLILNHKLGLNLSVQELVLLAVVCGLHIGQSRLGALKRLQAVLRVPSGDPVEAEEQPAHDS